MKIYYICNMREDGFYKVKKADFENYIDHWTISYWTVDHMNYSDSYWCEVGCSLTWKEDDYRYCEIGQKIELPKNKTYDYEDIYELSDESKILKEFYSEFESSIEITVKQRLDFANKYSKKLKINRSLIMNILKECKYGSSI